MSDYITYRQCPICKSAAITKEFSCKDHMVSKYVFEIWKCTSCTLRFTQSAPKEKHITNYYQSPDYVSHTNTRHGFINTLYHNVRSVTLRSKKRLIKKQTRLLKGTLLDAGAGTGAFAHTMQQAGWQVTAVEPDAIARGKALENYGLTLVPPMQLAQLVPASFDAITMWHVLEHVHDLHGYIDTFNKLLTANGKIFIAVPNYTGFDSTKYKNAWAAYDVPRHLYHFSPKSMAALMQLHGFEIQKIKPMWFDSFYVAMLTEKYFGKHGSMFRALQTGLITTLKTLKEVKKSSSLIYVIGKK